MATYQKRGYKKSIELEEEEVVVETNNEEIVEESTTAEVFQTLEETANKSEQWLEKNSKPLFIGLIATVAIIFGYVGYNQFVKNPTEKKAANALVYAKQEFTKATASNDSEAFKVALNGAEENNGLLYIADQFGGTSAGNLAKYYAGISYINLKDYDNAIEFLKDVSTDDAVLNTVIKGSLGDAFWAKGDTEKALDYFEEAASLSKNKAVTPVYLIKAGNVALSLKEYGKAEEFFTNVKENFPKSSQANRIDLYINQAKYAN